MVMSKLFEDLQEGLKQAVDHAEGNCEIQVVTYKIEYEIVNTSVQIRKM